MIKFGVIYISMFFELIKIHLTHTPLLSLSIHATVSFDISTSGHLFTLGFTGTVTSRQERTSSLSSRTVVGKRLLPMTS